MEIRAVDAILIIIALAGVWITWASTISSITEEQTKRFNSIIAKSKEFIIFWSVIGLCSFQIASEVASSDPISKPVIFKISLYTAFILFMVVIKFIQILMLKIKEINSTAKQHTNFIEKQLNLMGQHIELSMAQKDKLDEHQKFINQQKSKNV